MKYIAEIDYDTISAYALEECASAMMDAVARLVAVEKEVSRG